MKIVHICQYYNDGWGYQENLLPLYQKKLGHDVSIITSDRRPYYHGDPSPRIIGTGTYYDRGIRIERLPVIMEFRNRFVLFKNLKKQLELEKPDYIFHHNLTCPSLTTSAKYKKGLNRRIFLAADNHADLNISGRNIAWRNFYYHLVWKNLLKTITSEIDVVFGVTPIRCEFPHDHLGIPKDKIRFLPIGADVDWDEGKRKNWNRNTVVGDFFIEKDDIILVSGGKMDSSKNINILLDALNILKNPKVKLVLFGRIEDKQLENKIKSQENVFFKGWLDREQTMQLLSIADLAIWPGIHTTLVEDAIAVETPLILKYYGSTSHHIRGNGEYIYEEKANLLGQTIQKCISPTYLTAMKKAAYIRRKQLSYMEIAQRSITSEKASKNIL